MPFEYQPHIVKPPLYEFQPNGNDTIVLLALAGNNQEALTQLLGRVTL